MQSLLLLVFVSAASAFNAVGNVAMRTPLRAVSSPVMAMPSVDVSPPKPNLMRSNLVRRRSVLDNEAGRD